MRCMDSKGMLGIVVNDGRETKQESHVGVRALEQSRHASAYRARVD